MVCDGMNPLPFLFLSWISFELTFTLALSRFTSPRATTLKPTGALSLLRLSLKAYYSRSPCVRPRMIAEPHCSSSKSLKLSPKSKVIRVPVSRHRTEHELNFGPRTQADLQIYSTARNPSQLSKYDTKLSKEQVVIFLSRSLTCPFSATTHTH
ncbi:hypothetical protein BKA64DRAFT_339556 [Cadophora sp. MPI-SDFR-AT-0126]|nr:hypothetical protein BKA64DRAFT_339556 [Leotiomycetes sp. MPI-SDFR-AT-0126]